MLLHSDLKLRRWDPNVTVMNPQSVSPMRSYEDTLGGGRVLSMKPNYLLNNNNAMMNMNNPYRALYYLPQTQANEPTIAYTGEAMKENIESAVKEYLIQERRNLKQELVDEAMDDIRHEINHFYYVAEDDINDEYESRPKSERQRTISNMITEDLRRDSRNRTAKKSPKKRYADEEDDGTKENNPFHNIKRYKEDDSGISKRKKRDTSPKSNTHSKKSKKSKKDKKDKKDKKSKSRRECPKKIKALQSKSSKKSYEFDFETESPQKSKPKNSKRLYLKKTPKQNKSSHKREPEFTFEKQPKELQEELNLLRSEMKDFENQILSMVRNLKIDHENRSKLTEERVKIATDPIGDYQSLRTELEYTKNLLSSLEEERKKDMLRSKQFIEEKGQKIYEELEQLRSNESGNIDKKFEEVRLEIVDQLVENEDSYRKEMREIRYENDKNKEDITILSNNVQNLRRRTNEELNKDEEKGSRKTDQDIIRTVGERVEEQVDDNLGRIKKDMRKEFRQLVEDEINQNNESFVVPSIETYNKRNSKNTPIEKSIREPSLSASRGGLNMSNLELEQKIEETMEPKCTQICRKIIEEELELTKRNIVENEIEPICQKAMIEEFARSRRNIIDKEIEPKCREILEEETPLLCEKIVNKKFEKEMQENGVIRPLCRAIIDEEVNCKYYNDVIDKAIKDEFTDSRKMVIQNEIEPICQEIVEEKYGELINGNLEQICRDVVAEELEKWAQRERDEQFMESPMRNKIYKQNAKSAQQLPMQISKIDESMEEESPEALPRHHMPPQSLIDGRSSVAKSDSNFDSYSHDDRHFKFSADPKKPQSRMNPEKIVVLRESKQDKLRDYLNDKFRPPSENRSEHHGSRSPESSRYSMNRGSSVMAKNKLGPMISFGASGSKEEEENSQGMFKYTESSPKNRDTYSFLDPESRARNILNSMEKNPIEDTDLKNRVSFGKTTEDEEFKVMSKSVFSYSEDLNDSNKFGLGSKNQNMKSQGNFLDPQNDRKRNVKNSYEL